MIGSRLIPGGKIAGRGLGRNIVTQMANLYIRLILGLKAKDCTSGFRCYKKEVLNSIPLKHMISKGPSSLEEILYACQKKGFNIYEIPITFVDRRKGKSKLDLKELLKVFWSILRIRFQS
ncbi:MAG: hypothetical protein ABIJ41_01510 [Candidatus Omnitrophota bacterium]